MEQLLAHSVHLDRLVALSDSHKTQGMDHWWHLSRLSDHLDELLVEASVPRVRHLQTMVVVSNCSMMMPIRPCEVVA
jgi:hypothetical protein